MIFVNLLPKIKIEFVRIQKFRRFLTGLLIIVTPICLGLFSWLYYQVNISHPSKIEELDQTTTKVIKSINDLAAGVIEVEVEVDDDKPALGFDKILTVRSQLEALGDLHKLKPEVERLFSFHRLHYLDSLISKDLGTYEQINFNFLEGTFSISGQTHSLSEGIQLRDSLLYIGLKEGCTLENREYREYPITLTSFPNLRANTSTSDDEAQALNYSITGRFEPKLFESLALKYSQIGQESPSAYKHHPDYNHALKNLDEYFDNLTLVTPEIISSDDFDAKPTHNCQSRRIEAPAEE
ncbi:MAG: hypothetical protein OXF49_02665 [Candidatus Saccharibacteria bacterium]|nr:hypothetical protein [Candidatus Saccharibacteria bacterium]MCY4089000.1 hypothetical protein [Candidatus Saccharibacteria bacterium]